MNLKSEITSLNISIDPQTVYISTDNAQASYAEIITVTVQNAGNNSVAIKAVAVAIPDSLAPYGPLDDVSPVANPSEFWNFNLSQVNVGEFDATPVSGSAVPLNPNDEWQFSLLHVTLVNVIIQSPVTISVLITFADGTTQSQPLMVNIDATTASVSFTCMPATINPGETSVLTWDCMEIDYVVIDELGDEHRNPTDSADVSPNDNTTYTLYAYGSGVVLSDQRMITVGNPEVITFGGIDGITSVNYGSMLNLTWSCNQFTKSITIADDKGVNIPDLFTNGNNVEHGTITVGPIVTSTRFDLTTFGDTKENFVHAYQPIDINDVSFRLTVTPDGDIWEQDKVTLNWNIISASNVSLTPEIEGGPSLDNLSGEVTIYPQDDILYTFCVNGLCQNNPVEHTEKIQKSVSKVAINNFTMFPELIEFDSVDGNSCTFTWNTDAELVTISNIGTVNTVDSTIINAPADGTVYKLSAGTAQNPGILTESFTIVNLHGPYRFDSFKSDPGDPTALDLIVPIAGSMKLLAGSGNGVYYILQLTGVTSPNDPYLNYITGSCYYSSDDKQPSFFIAIYDTTKQPDAPLELQWTDPNNQSGTITVTGSINP